MNHLSHWRLNPDITLLNHGSFGACPKTVLSVQNTWREKLESEPVAFFLREYESELDSAREVLASLVGSKHEDLVFIPNATYGVNAVLRSLTFEPGQEILVTDHNYNACRNAVDYVADRFGVKVTVANIPFPLEDSEQVVKSIVDATTSQTRLALIDHVTSDTGLIFPIERIVSELEGRGIRTLIDGAHAPGMLPLDISAIAPSYYTGNCHKWLCAPKGAGFLWVKEDLQEEIRPLSISHGANSNRSDRSRYLNEFSWTGTSDPSPWLSVPAAIDFVSSLCDDGLAGLQTRNRDLVIEGRKEIASILGSPEPCPVSMLGSLATIPLPDSKGDIVERMKIDPLQDRLYKDFRIEVPVMPWPNHPKRLIRISAFYYNEMGDYESLAKALEKIGGLS